MKKTLLAIALCGSLGIGSAMAAADEAAVQNRVEAVKSEFNLSDQQAKRIANILSRGGMSEDEKKAARMEKRMTKRLERMTEKLNLSDNQVTQLRTIMTQQQEQRQMLREQGKASILSILTAEQANKFEEMMANRKKGHRGYHGKHRNMCGKH